MHALTLDQIRLLLTVVDEGSFSNAAKKLNRAQSWVHSIQVELPRQEGEGP